jgi:hypothetical protein
VAANASVSRANWPFLRCFDALSGPLMGLVKDQLFNAVFYAMNQTQVMVVAVVAAAFSFDDCMRGLLCNSLARWMGR